MPKHDLFIAAYDVCNPSRLRRVHQVVKSFATGGQKSAFECFLSSTERKELLASVRRELDLDEDRFALLKVEERAKPILRGIALPANDSSFYYVG